MVGCSGWTLRARTTLLPMAALGVYAIFRKARDERMRANREARDKAALVAAQVGYRTAAVGEMLAALTNLPAIRAGNWRAAERVLQEHLATAPHPENLGLVAPDSMVSISAVPLPPGTRISVVDRVWYQQVIRTHQPENAQPAPIPSGGKEPGRGGERCEDS